MDLLDGFLWGLFGGFIAEVLGLFRLRQQVNRPEYLKSPFYWIITVLMMCAGGILVVAYMKSDVKLNALIAINLGASAPLIIGSFVAQVPTISPGRVD